jgi:hypothetical protein
MASARARAVTIVLVALGAGACSSGKSATTTTTRPIVPSSPATGPTTTGSTTTGPTTTGPTPTGRATPAVTPTPHVMVVMMENKSYTQVIGQPDQPYTNRLATTYGVATESFAFGHPSLPNYIDLVSGSNQGVTDDNPPSSHRFPGAPTLADQLVAAGYSAKAYAENLPADPTTSAGSYAVRHVPWEYFPRAPIPVADASALLGDLNGARAPAFVWFTPNLIDDEHDGTVQQGDAFLSRFVPTVQSTAWYRSGGEIIVQWDESDADNSGINGTGGGHVPTIVISSALASHPQRDTTPVDTAGVLRSIEDVYGLPHLGAAADAANGSIDVLLGPNVHARS